MSAYGDLVTTDPVINAESRQSTLIAVLIAFPIVSVVAISLRLYTRVYMLRYAGPDDISICVAEVSIRLSSPRQGKKMERAQANPGFLSSSSPWRLPSLLEWVCLATMPSPAGTTNVV